MKHRQKSGASRIAEREPGLDLSSLIDVSFLLLIYFLVTSTLNTPDADLDMSLRPDGPDLGPSIDKPVIEIDSAGNVLYTKELIETDVTSGNLPELKDRLETYLAAWNVAPAGREPGIIVDADDSAKGQRFIDVLNCLAEVGITDVAMTFRQDDE